MNKTKKVLELPAWFEGEHYVEGGVVTNPFSGQSIELSPNELSMYDFVMGCNTMFEMGQVSPKVVKLFDKGRYWILKSNPQAYMILLD